MPTLTLGTWAHIRNICLRYPLTTGLRALVAGAIALAVLGAMSERTRAATIDTQIGAFGDGGTFEYVLGLATTSDKSDKTAALMIRGPDPTKNEYKRRVAFFSDRQQWNQFVALWNKARLTRAPKRANINGDSIKIGRYSNDTNEGLVLVSVSVNDDATIEFDLIDKDKWPMLFRLQPKNFKAFDGAVKKITEYFEN